jgi:hypothetical protein
MSKTRLRELRRDARRALGVSSDPAPEAGQAIEAAAHVSEMLRLTSGRFVMEIRDKRTGQYVTPGEAWRIHREEQRAYNEDRLRRIRGEG